MKKQTTIKSERPLKMEAAIPEWIRQSNLIEGVDDPQEDARSNRAWRWFINQPLTLDTIRALHRKIMFKKLAGRRKGNWRECQVWIGGREAPRWENVPGLMAEWLETRGKTDLTVDPIKAHIAFERIHPFVDGNGRTGRMIMNWQRSKCGIEPLLIKFEERWEYYKWFKKLK